MFWLESRGSSFLLFPTHHCAAVRCYCAGTATPCYCLLLLSAVLLAVRTAEDPAEFLGSRFLWHRPEKPPLGRLSTTEGQRRVSCRLKTRWHTRCSSSWLRYSSWRPPWPRTNQPRSSFKLPRQAFPLALHTPEDHTPRAHPIRATLTIPQT